MLRALIIEFFVQSFHITLFPFLLFFVLRLLELVGILHIQRSIIIILFFFFAFYWGILLSLLGLSGPLLHWLNWLFSIIGDGRNRTGFLLVASGLLLPLWGRRLFLFISSVSQSLYLFIYDFGIIIILSSDGLLLPFLKATDLDGNALEPIDLILDVLGQIIIFVFYCFFLLHLELLNPGHGRLINIHARLAGLMFLVDRRELLSTGPIEGEPN